MKSIGNIYILKLKTENSQNTSSKYIFKIHLQNKIMSPSCDFPLVISLLLFPSCYFTLVISLLLFRPSI